MSWMNPFMLFGFAAVGVPILIHLLNRQRYRVLDWAAQEFLKRALRKHQRKIKLQEWILLLLRCLAIMAIVGMLLRPVASQSFGQSSRLRILVVDVSASMSSKRGNISALKNAENAIVKLLDESNPADDIEIFAVHDELKHILRNTQASNRKEILTAVNNLSETQSTAKACRYDVIAKELESHVKKANKASVEIFVFSDFQATALEGKKFPIGELEDNTWHFHDCGLKERDNWAISAMHMEAPNIVKDQTTFVEVEVTSFSKLPKNVKLRLFEGKQLIGDKKLNIAAGSKATASFQMVFKESGSRYLKAVLELDGDTLDLDNTRQVGVTVTEKIPVVMMDGDPYGASYWKDETFMFRYLLESRGKYKIQVFKKGADDFDSIDLNETRLLVMANVPTPSSPFMKKVETFVKSGGALIVTGGPNLEGKNATQNFGDLLPVTFEDDKALVPDEAWKIDLTSQRYVETHALREAKSLQLALVERMHHVKAKEGARTMVRANNRYPILVHHTMGKGHVAFWASSLDKDWCDIVLENYVLMLGVLAEHMIEQSSIREALPGKDLNFTYNTFTIGDSASWFYPAKDIEHLLKTEADDVDKNKSNIKVKGAITQFAGLYMLRGRSGNTLTYVGVNVDGLESDLSGLQDDKILRNDNDKITLSRSMEAFNSRLGSDSAGKEIWKTLLIMAMSFLALEGFLAWKWGNPK